MDSNAEIQDFELVTLFLTASLPCKETVSTVSTNYIPSAIIVHTILLRLRKAPDFRALSKPAYARNLSC